MSLDTAERDWCSIEGYGANFSGNSSSKILWREAQPRDSTFRIALGWNTRFGPWNLPIFGPWKHFIVSIVSSLRIFRTIPVVTMFYGEMLRVLPWTSSQGSRITIDQREGWEHSTLSIRRWVFLADGRNDVMATLAWSKHEELH